MSNTAHRYICKGGFMLITNDPKAHVEEFVSASDYDDLRLSAGGMEMTIWELEDEVKKLKTIINNIAFKDVDKLKDALSLKSLCKHKNTHYSQRWGEHVCSDCGDSVQCVGINGTPIGIENW